MQKGVVVWITGLSASGKTTVSTEVVKRLRSLALPIVHYDGDVLRNIFGNKWGYSPEERRELAGVYSKLCKNLSDQSINVVISTIAMFESVRTWNRTNIERYIEVFLDVPMDVLRERDYKGIYKKDAYVGLDTEFPETPDLVLKNYDDMDPDKSAAHILKCFFSILSDGKTEQVNFRKLIKSYWDLYYQAKDSPRDPSSFAQFCAGSHLNADDIILDVGCGNGRDSFFFSKDHKTIGLDVSETAIAKDRLESYNGSSPQNVVFLSGIFGEDVMKLPWPPTVIYSRFVLHAMDEQAEDNLLAEAYRILPPDGRMLLEFRTTKDPLASRGIPLGEDGACETFTDHYRRFINFEKFLGKLAEIGFAITYSKEQQGVAVHGDDDPVVGRIVATKRTTSLAKQLT